MLHRLSVISQTSCALVFQAMLKLPFHLSVPCAKMRSIPVATQGVRLQHPTGVAMRLLMTGFVGGAIAAVAYLAAGITAGYAQAGLFITAVGFGAMTLGVAAVVVVEGLEDRLALRKHRRGVGYPRFSSRGNTSSRTRCGVCKQAMEQLGSLWVCGVCDRSFSHL
jgi:hypothetical protein